MTADEAVILFKSDCEKDGWERIVRRYNERNINTLVQYIAVTYNVIHKNEIKKALRIEFQKTLDEIKI